MKAILISDHAIWCAKMMNRIKKIEVRKGTTLYKAIKKHIEQYGYADIYVYCSKINRKHYHLIESIDTDTGETDYEIDYYIGSEDYLDWCFDGKVAFKFRCYKVEEIEIVYNQENEFGGYSESFGTKTLSTNELLNKSKLDYFELAEYLKDYEPFGYAIHISDLEIFDKPKELSEFRHYGKPSCDSCSFQYSIECDYHREVECDDIPLIKAPQSFMYIEEK